MAGTDQDVERLIKLRGEKDSLFSGRRNAAQDGSFCLLGDGGYPCTTRPIAIMTSYREPVRNPVHARFNFHHAKGRSIIERSFGIPKARWRSIFFKALEVKPDFAVQVITCCAVLHNLCMIDGDILEPVEGAVVPDDTAILQDEDDSQNGEHLRSHLAAALSAPDIPRTSSH
ncbi:hypothetical protein SKAU_G00124630 [Synaphobranchus kaupii]|uniref:DDE Tnp4 domain-containing protein n=1 Tax=Synaphobranchus kaupii TaxID=118154 RepID=A0A9Q1J0L9_SYNKA|nr:hypothetical protein SKAU_G00124630 [Synaphobranchus kaupii]